MPSATFFNLAEEKRKRIFDAAVDEFSTVRYSEGSINRIIKQAGIPRGSFYQYFKDKEDLYLYILEEIGKEKSKVFSEYQIDADGGFFEAALAAMPAVAEWAGKCPKYNQLAMLMAQDGSRFIREMMDKLGDSKSELAELFRRDQEKGLIRKDINIDLVIEMYYYSASKIADTYYTMRDYEKMQNSIREVFDILGNGIYTRREEPNGTGSAKR